LRPHYLEIKAQLLPDLSGPSFMPVFNNPDAIEPLQSKAAYLLHVLQDRSGEYLFFIGAAYLCLLLRQRKKWIYATLASVIALVWLTFHLPVSLYLQSLGVDSFAETEKFDFQEARFWLQTMGEAVSPSLSLKKLLVYLVFSIASFYGLTWLLDKTGIVARNRFRLKLSLSALLIGLALQQTTAEAISFYFENTEMILTTAKNFDNEAPEIDAGHSKTNLIVYIGESTTVMNMGLYGYPRRTTPLLSELAQKDKNLIVFENVFSTHSLTTRSLLEALSFGLDKREMYLPITQRKRVPVVDVLKKAGLEPMLISNQGMNGAWDQTGSVIFKNSAKVFSLKVRSAGNSDLLIDKPWDDEFFEEQLAAVESRDSAHRRAVFLHSYAGHGPYHRNIPDRFRTPVDGVLTQLESDPIDKATRKSIEEYDAALRYVDYSISKIISRVKASSRPLILVYFSDHGEAVYSGKGHDSARFEHEMVRIPFVVYFNDAARQDSAGIFEKYQRLASQKEIATLAQLAPTLVDLLGIGLRDGTEHPAGARPVMGEKTALAPIMIRETAEGTTFVNLNSFPLTPPPLSKQAFIDRTDSDTQTYLAVRSGAKTMQEACRAYPGTLEGISRSILLARCQRMAIQNKTTERRPFDPLQ
jgi:glucan phosphoethanolaminetransferase (alkaline phosphatase superfamily)